MILTANLNFSNVKFNVICIDGVVMTASLAKLLILNAIAYYIIVPAAKKFLMRILLGENSYNYKEEVS